MLLLIVICLLFLSGCLGLVFFVFIIRRVFDGVVVDDDYFVVVVRHLHVVIFTILLA